RADDDPAPPLPGGDPHRAARPRPRRAPRAAGRLRGGAGGADRGGREPRPAGLADGQPRRVPHRAPRAAPARPGDPHPPPRRAGGRRRGAGPDPDLAPTAQRLSDPNDLNIRARAARLTPRSRYASLAAMLSWGRFRRSAPHLAAAGRALLYRSGVGLAYLGTV